MAETLRELVIKITVDADKKPLDDVGDSTDKAGTKAIALGNILGNLGTKLIDVGLEAAKAAGAFAVDLVTGFAETGDEIAKTSQKIGVATDDLQRLRFAGERSGIASEQLTAGIRDFNTVLQEGLIKGSGPAVDFLGEIGLELEDLANLGAEERIGLVADAMGAVETESEKAALSVKLFGGAGADILPLLSEGSEGIRALGDEAESLGAVMSEDAAASAAELADSMFNLETFIEGVEREIGQALAPTATDIIDQIREWIQENDQFIKQDLPKILGQIGQILVDLLPLVAETVSAFASIGDEVDDLNERMGEDWPQAWAFAGEAIEALFVPISAISDAIGGLVDQVLGALEQFEAAADFARSIRAGLGLDDTATVEQRGLAGVERETVEVFEGGTAETAGRSAVFVGAETTDAGLRAIIDDPQAPAGVRAEAAGVLEVRELDALFAEQARAGEQADRKRERAALLETARGRRRKAVGRRGRGGGGGGGPAAAEPTIEELIAGAVGGPGAGPAGGASSPLSGTIFVTQDNRQILDVNIGTIDVQIPQGAIDLQGTTTAQLATAMREAARVAVTDEIRPAFNALVAGGVP